MSKWIPGKGFYFVQPSSKEINHVQNKKNLELLEIRLQKAQIKLGIQNG